MVSTNWSDASKNSTNWVASSVNSTDYKKNKDGTTTLGDTSVTLASTTINMQGQDTSGDPDTYTNSTNWS